ncbi:MAG TPA: glycosyltransferase 87 family protein, partial [Urbifossiella sp.]|nr:glycosyltransferase 87 family protein [Urbifossiella sp.]
VAYVLTLAFVPTIFLIGSGQITAFVLVGLAGFLAAARAGRWGVAGAVGALTAVKPHLLGLFALMLVLDALRARSGRRVVLAGLAVGLLACVPPTLLNPDVWAQYHTATTGGDSASHYGVSHWAPPLAGWWLRTGFGLPFAVQFLPFVVAAVGFVVWYWKQPPTDAANVADRLPVVVGVSLLAAPYGVWQFDLVLLVVPMLATAAQLARRPNTTGIAAGAAVLLGANAVALAMMMNQFESKWYVWFAPVVLGGCWASCSAARGLAACAPLSRKRRSPEPEPT